MHAEPSAEVISALGESGPPVRLEGGAGQTWRVNSVVFKRVDPIQADFEAGLTSSLKQNGYRLAKMIKSSSGAWSIDSWSAYSLVAGEHRPGEYVEERFLASRQLHQDLQAIPHSSHFDEHPDPWTIAQLIAFGQLTWEPEPRLRPLLDFFGHPQHKIPDSWQVIHADIGGNFLFDPGLPPAIIDLTLKWSPTGLAEAVMAVDLVLWEGVSLTSVLQIANEAEKSLVPLAACRRILEMDTLHRIGGWSDSIFDQVTDYERFAAEYESATARKLE